MEHEYDQPHVHENVPTKTEASDEVSESALNDLLSAASREYDQMAPHVRKRKNGILIKDLIEQNRRMQGQLKIVEEVNEALGIIGMTGSIAWKAQLLKLSR